MPDTLRPSDYSGHVPAPWAEYERDCPEHGVWWTDCSPAGCPACLPAPKLGRVAQLERITDDMCEFSHPGLTHAEAWPDRTRGGWRNVPRWYRWTMLAVAAVTVAAGIVGLVQS